jgi:hypothetical protein
MRRYRGPPCWSTADLMIWSGSFCMVELRRLEPLTPCLQNRLKLSDMVAHLGLRL